MSSGLQVIEEAMLASGAESMRKAVDYLLAARKPEGYWWGDLTADSTLESDWLLLLLWLHPPQGGVWVPPDEAKVARAVRAILAKQNDDGGFHIFADGPSDLSASVKAYFALKLAGLALDDSRMIRLRELIL